MESEWASGIDIERPSVARMYDYYLGGSHNFAADREAARKLMEAVPDVTIIAQANRAFLRRAVRFLVGAGIRQFLDIGSGIPTYGNVHEIAQLVAPETRVVYVDIDPVAVSHSQQILVGNDRACVVQADLRRPKDLLARLGDAVDFDQPVALMLVAVLHFLPGEEAYEAVEVLYDMLPAGSYLTLSHNAAESFTEVGAREADRAREAYQDTATPPGVRNRAEVERFFDGFALVEPGLVWTSQWRPDDADSGPDDPARAGMFGGVGRKR